MPDDWQLRDGIRREVIAWECLADLPSPELQRLIGFWIGASLPHAHFECERFTVEGK